MQKLPRLKSVKAAKAQPFVLNTTWDDGTKATIDLTGLVHSFKPFQVFIDDPKSFATVQMVDWGSGIEWSNGLDYSAHSLRLIADEQRAMTGKEFEAIWKTLGVNAEELALILGVSTRTVRDARQSTILPPTWGAMMRRCATDPTFFAALYKPRAVLPRGRPKSAVAG